MQSEYESPEVKAARAAIPHQHVPVPTIPAHARIDPPLDSLFREMIWADEVFILGSLPWECSQRLIALEQERRDAKEPSPGKKTVHYFIPEREAKNTGASMGPRIQRWVAGLFGVRNWIVPHRDESTNRDRLVIYNYRYDAGGCTVLTRKGDYFAATGINYLPVPAYPARGVLTVASYENEQRDIIRRHIYDDLLRKSRRYEIRQVRCIGPRAEVSSDPDDFTPVFLRLTKQRGLDSTETEPAVVVAICGRTSLGPVVMLKRRHKGNAIDDFDTLSLVSEHVIVDDLTTWVGKLREPLNDDDNIAQEQLWMAARRPDKLILEEQFFAEAAQRELFISCGLNVSSDRLRFCGYRRVSREDSTHLGFAVYRLDLVQQDNLNELQTVRDWSADMQVVPIAQLYQQKYLGSLNRLLRLQQHWLRDNVFSPAPTPPGGGQ